MRFFASLIFACLPGFVGLSVAISAARAQPAPAATPAPNAKTMFLIRSPDGYTAIRAVSYQLQGVVLVLVNESGGRAVVQPRSVVGRLPWASDEEIASGKIDLEEIAKTYEASARRLPALQKFLSGEAARFRDVVKKRETEQAAREQAAAQRVATATSAAYRIDAGYTIAALETMIAVAEEVRAALPDAADRIDQWAAPFRDHLAKLKAGDRYEKGVWVTPQDLAHRAQVEREAAFLRAIDFAVTSETLPAAVVRGAVTKIVGAAFLAILAGIALLVFARRHRAGQLAGIALVAGSPLALAAIFFLATRTPPSLPAAVPTDESSLVVSALADAAGLTSAPPASRTISSAALNSFLARHVRLQRPVGFDFWTPTREAIAAQFAPGRLSLFELVRCVGLTWIIRYDLAFPNADSSGVIVQNVRLGALDCPPELARLLWGSLEPPLVAILAATKTAGYFTIQKPVAGAIELTRGASTPPPPATTSAAPSAPANASGSPAAPVPAASGNSAATSPPAVPSAGSSSAGSDTWAATDNLGRTLPDSAQTGPPKPGKTVGIFYYLWHGFHDQSAFDISRVLEKSPNAIHDSNDPAWGRPNGFHYWSEPLYGYYRAGDEWVIRKNAQLLADAGVDVVFFDVTNAERYSETYQKLADIYADIRAKGNRTPQIAFLTGSKSGKVVQALYDEFYAKGTHRDLWFQWDGKPLILAKAAEIPEALKSFFTVRESWAWKPGAGKWPWLEDSPQEGGLDAAGKLEEVAVATASHPTINIGKSFTDKKQPPADQLASGEGRRFAEQWNRALALDPPVIFVTQWNEWIAQRFVYDGPGQTYAGRPLKKGEPWFVDDYDPEFNRDIEPMKGGYEDNYYYQLAANIRRFKGVRPTPTSPGPKTIAAMADWDSVEPVYPDDRGDTFHRDSPGADPATIYQSAWGRNDIIQARVAADAENVYFYAESAEPLTALPAAATPAPSAPPAVPGATDATGGFFGQTKKDAVDSAGNWMQLLIDADHNAATGWFGYDYVLNRLPAETAGAAIERYDSTAKTWVKIGQAPQQIEDKRVALAIPRSLLPELGSAPLRFDFKWADNVPLAAIKSPAEFLLYGDVAPNARYNYRFIQ